MLLNLSNHPSKNDKGEWIWSEEQLKAAHQYGEVIDMKFPVIPPEWGTDQVAECALEFFKKCKKEIGGYKLTSAVHLAGEPVFCFLLAQLLLKQGYTCLSATTQRKVVIKDNIKESKFDFGRFREYKLITYDE